MEVSASEDMLIVKSTFYQSIFFALNFLSLWEQGDVGWGATIHSILKEWKLGNKSTMFIIFDKYFYQRLK